jgi:hypothetical protein
MDARFDTVSEFLEHVGRSAFEKNLGHKTQVVTRAISKNEFPAHWYFGCRDWCREIGVDVPEHLFRQAKRPTKLDQQDAKDGLTREALGCAS